MKQRKSRPIEDAHAGSKPDRVVTSRFVEPDPEQPDVLLQRSLESAGWCTDAAWLAPILIEIFSPQSFQLDSPHANWIARAAAVGQSREARLREIIARIQGFGSDRFAGPGNQGEVAGLSFLSPMRPPYFLSWLQRIVELAAGNGIDVAEAMLGGWPEVVVESDAAAAEQLRADAKDVLGRSDLDERRPVFHWMDLVKSIVEKVCPDFHPKGSAPLGNVRSELTWLYAFGPAKFGDRVASELGGRVEGNEDQLAAAVAAERRMRDAANRPVDCAKWSNGVLHLRRTLEDYGIAIGWELDGDHAFSNCPAVVALLIKGASFDSPESRKVPEYRAAMLWLAALGYASRRPWGERDHVPPEPVRHLSIAIGELSLSLLRSVAGHRGPGGPRDEATAASEFLEFVRTREFENAAQLLYAISSDDFSMWLGMKPLLLALRASKMPAVAEDLRYWPEAGLPNPPEPWSRIVLWMISLFHANAESAERSDPELVGLRSKLAEFCLERLGDRLHVDERASAPIPRRPADMLESSAEWRYALIRAFQVLETDLDGRAKRILELSARIDPDPAVREAADIAVAHLHRGDSLAEDVSPRRSVLSAIWWIRQGHLLALGVVPDRDGAQRTRMRELSRTRERRRGSD